MKRLKIVLLVVAGFLLLVVVLQNTKTVETRILSATIDLPLAILLFIAVLFGFALGFATAWWSRLRTGRRKVETPPESSKPPAADAEKA